MLAFVVFTYFHPGGGWNQNARFAQLRAIVESGELSIDSYLVYRRRSTDESSTSLERLPARNGVVTADGRDYRLTWFEGHPVDVEARGDEDTILTSEAVSGDVAYRGGHFFPNKAPGTTMLAIPAYALVASIAASAGYDLDDAGVMNVLLWLSSVLSIALVAAAGVVIFFRVCRDFLGASARAAAIGALTLAFGTPYFAYGTLLYEHDVVAVSLLGAYAAAVLVAAPAKRAAAAGLLSAFAAASNYIAAAAAPVVLWLVWRRRRSMVDLFWFAAGAAPIAVALAGWNLLAYGAVSVGHYGGENPLYRTPGAFLGVLTLPSPTKVIELFFSPHRGLFASAPVLLLAAIGWGTLLSTSARADRLAALGIGAPFFLFTLFFEHWHGGATYAPRYLVPALPFLAFGLVEAWKRSPRAFAAVAALSVSLNLLAVAVDPQVPVGIHPLATDHRRPIWSQSPFVDYVFPLFLTGRAGPSAEMPRSPLAAIGGTISTNVLGAYDSGWFKHFPPESPASRLASFNLGELVFPESRLSLVPLLVFAAFSIWRIARTAEPSRRSANAELR